MSHESIDLTLIRSVDEHKDQTYFLYQLRQEQLEHILFPIGHLTKPQVREEAIRRNLLTAKKPDSQGVCFIGEVSVSKFLEERIKHKAGEIRYGDLEVGSHKGVWFYTVGQKIAGMDAKKLAQAGFDTTRLPHFYVQRKDVINNVLYIGTEDQLYSSKIKLTDIHWIGEQPTNSTLTVRIRHTGELVEAELIDNHLKLQKPVWGVAPGQVVVLYQGAQCVGGGIIV
jgi:tRNA-specific 2-thiouridylase